MSPECYKFLFNPHVSSTIAQSRKGAKGILLCIFATLCEILRARPSVILQPIVDPLLALGGRVGLGLGLCLCACGLLLARLRRDRQARTNIFQPVGSSIL